MYEGVTVSLTVQSQTIYVLLVTIYVLGVTVNLTAQSQTIFVGWTGGLNRSTRNLSSDRKPLTTLLRRSSSDKQTEKQLTNSFLVPVY